MLYDFILGLISSSSRDCFMKMYLILSTLFISCHSHGLVWCNTSAVHLHSFRFAGGSLTAGDRPHFSENGVSISSFDRVDFIIDERFVYQDVSLHSTGLISYRREIDLVSLYSWFGFSIFERLFYDGVSYSLDVRYFMACLM